MMDGHTTHSPVDEGRAGSASSYTQPAHANTAAVKLFWGFSVPRQLRPESCAVDGVPLAPCK